MNVLALNSGSSSLKFGLYRVDAAAVEALFARTLAVTDTQGAIQQIADALDKAGMPAPTAIGHRIVHGGPQLRRHGLVDAAMLARLDAASAFAPLHMPAALALMGQARSQFPGVPQAACFDTCFHASLPDVARVLPIPRALESEGLQRYGFHGLSLESIVRQLGSSLPRRVVVAHLGHGASVSALLAGRSIDTSMGLTPTGGVLMGTRSGDLDPGVLLYLLREKQYDASRLQALVDQRSGLLGISGIASDMRQLHEAAASSQDARLAIDMFCYGVRKQIAAMAAALEGLDLLVFTGGIGENDAKVREAICAGLGWLGVDYEADGPNSGSASRCAVRVVATQEDEQIARHTWDLLVSPSTLAASHPRSSSWTSRTTTPRSVSSEMPRMTR